LVVPFFLYVGIKRTSVPEEVFYACLVLGAIVTLYHLGKAILRLRAQSSFVWVNLIHALIVGPLLIAIGSMKKEAPRSLFEMLLLVAFAAGGYHLYEFVSYTNFQA
jgi:hypothetical protein